jgi:hypothetical protein
MSPIAEAVEPLRASAIQHAAEYARTFVDRVLANLESHKWDLNSAYPQPNISMGAIRYAFANMQRATASKLVTWRSSSIRHGQPCFVDPCQKGCEKFIQDARENADATYTLFIEKLESKVGEHVRATLEGNHVWGHSVLTVLTPDGEQKWKTQQIINVSKLGKVFNQWPTRLMKGNK